MRFLVVGATEPLGAALCRALVRETRASVLGLGRHRDGLHRAALVPIASHGRFSLRHAPQGDQSGIGALLDVFEPSHVVHIFPADIADRRSSEDAVRAATVCHWQTLPQPRRQAFRYLPVHVGPDAHHRVCDAIPPDTMPEVGIAAPLPFGPFARPAEPVAALLLAALRGQVAAATSGEVGRLMPLLSLSDAADALGCIAMRGHPGACYVIPATGLLDVARFADVAGCGIYPPADLEAGLHRAISPPGVDDLVAGGRGVLSATSLGWRPRQTCEQALASAITWYRANMAWATAMDELVPQYAVRSAAA